MSNKNISKYKLIFIRAVCISKDSRESKKNIYITQIKQTN